MSDGQLVRLYQGRGSSASWRVRIALALKQVPYESVLIDMRRGDNRSASYLAVNPMGQVPTLEIDGVRLTQSVAIIEYLDETRPQPHLLPESPAWRARARQIVEILNSGTQPFHNSAVHRSLKASFNADEDGLRTWTQPWIDRGLSSVEAVLAETAGQYCVGDELSIADVFLYAQIGKLAELKIDIPDSTKIAHVMGALKEHPVFANSGPENVPSTASA
ncbi:MAG TPA: maleylacetoacetate isomerase [Candidatus Acidoferrales bacterium]|nr:maleylacetoacetate isomerase [Candidatus Acidoferrales bacterium]